ncbi:urease accessory protein UreE [Tepidimonas sp.]|uniref:urease accessory protein UreE n=1 Tax=Tepidimonas sp. TaxID=2002775 RepID=UPI002FE2A7F0
MLTAARLTPRGQGLAAALLDRSAWISLNWDQRQKSRFDCDDSHGRWVGVFLAPGTVLRGGDVLLTEDGALLRVQTAAQPVLRVTPCPEHGTPLDLLHAAYHLDNRHVPLEVQADHLKLEPDPVLADMLRQMQLIVTEAREPFEPEAGAYAAHPHGHSHEHSHGHPHDQPPP